MGRQGGGEGRGGGLFLCVHKPSWWAASLVTTDGNVVSDEHEEVRFKVHIEQRLKGDLGGDVASSDQT